MNCWTLTESSFDPEQNLACEGLFTQGNGYLHVRGSLEERLADSPQHRGYMRMPGNATTQEFSETHAKWGTYVPGTYGKHPLLDNEMINLPYFLGLEVECDGERFDPTRSTFHSWKRSRSLRDGVLERSFCWSTPSGSNITVALRRFISAARTHLAIQELRIATDRTVKIRVISRLDADVRTSGFDHFADVQMDAERNLARATVTIDRGDQVWISSQLSGSGWQGRADARDVELLRLRSNRLQKIREEFPGHGRRVRGRLAVEHEGLEFAVAGDGILDLFTLHLAEGAQGFGLSRGGRFSRAAGAYHDRGGHDPEQDRKVVHRRPRFVGLTILRVLRVVENDGDFQLMAKHIGLETRWPGLFAKRE